jgi:hypothetical protein
VSVEQYYRKKSQAKASVAEQEALVEAGARQGNAAPFADCDRVLEPHATSAAAMPALAGQADLAIIHDQCGVQLNQPPPVCDCIASSASVKLNENQQAFMAAQITSNGPEIGRTQALLDQSLSRRACACVRNGRD